MMKRRDSLAFFLVLPAAIAYALIFFYANTPLGPGISSDTAMYLTKGTALSKGYAPYTQIFDHKGPLLFLLQMLPQLVGGGYSTLAVFAQEVCFLAASLLAVAAIARALGAPRLPALLAYLALSAPLLDGGNLTEEYACLFTLLGLYAIVSAFGQGLSEGTDGLLSRAALLGAMAALAFLTRANNALVLLGMTLALALCLLLTRRFAQLGRCALGFVLGAAAACAPVALWLAANGALGASVYGSILHNLMYAETNGASRVQTLLHTPYGHIALLLAAASCLGALTQIRKSPALALAMVAGAAAAGLAGFISHKFYRHYLLLGVPLAAMGVCALLGWAQRRHRRAGQALAAAAMLACALVLIPAAQDTDAVRREWRGRYLSQAEDAKALYALVPENERDRFMAYRVEPMWYVAAEALPCMRFYFLQEILADADPAVMDEIVATLESDPPEWLVIYYDRPFSPPYDARVQAIFDTRYAFVQSRGDYQLLRLKEETP